MRPATAGVLTYLQNPSSYFPKKADLYTVTLLDGVTVYRWTDFDATVTYTTDTFLPQGPLLRRSRLGVKNTVEVPELIINLAALDTDFVGGLGVKQQLHNGWFDLATVQLSRAVLLLNYVGQIVGVDMLGAYPGGLFTGRMSTVKLTAIGAELTIKGANVVMNQDAPRNTTQVPCMHTFCDANCTLAKATYTISNTVGASPTRIFIPWGSVPGTPSKYSYGTLTMTSGAASGQKRSVKQATTAGLLLQYPLYNTPSPGDTFSVLEGCDKTLNTGSGQDCSSRSNTQHFRGFPFIPPVETAF